MQGSWKKRSGSIAWCSRRARCSRRTRWRIGTAGGTDAAACLGGIERGVDQLELTPENRKAADAIFDEARTELRALRDQRRAAHEQMKTLLDEQSPSLEAVFAQADAISALETQAKKTELGAMVKVRQLLTTEQWQELRTQHGPGKGGPRCDGEGDGRTPA
jgi:Spy/CpxP family protein refolding chaperone